MLTAKQLPIPKGGLVYEVDSELLQDFYTPNSKNVHSLRGDISTRPGLSDLGPQDISAKLYLYYDANDDSQLGLRIGSNDNIKLAQSFTTAAVSRTIDRITLKLKHNGSITAGKLVYITVETDNAGAPSGTPVSGGTSGNVLCSAISGTAGWITFTFASALTLSSSTKYWIVLQGDYTESGTNYIEWEYDASSSPYTDGDAFIFDSSWATAGASRDFMFRVYRDTTVVMMTDTFKLKSGTTYIMMATLDRLFYLNTNEDAWVDISGYLASNLFTGTADDRFSYDVYFATDTFLITNYVNNIKKWAATGNCSNLGGSPPRTKYLKVYKDHLVLAYVFDGGEDRPYRVAWSAVGDIEVYTADVTAGYRDLLDSDDKLNGLNIVNDFLVTTKERTIYVGYAVTSSYTFQFDLKISGMGPIANDLILAKGDKMLFVGWDNLYIYTAGSVLTPIANERIRREFFETTDPQYFIRYFSYDVELDTEWHICVATAGNSYPNKIWVYNYFEKTFWTYTPSFTISCAGRRVQSSVPTIDDLVGTIDQQLWRIDDVTVSGFNDINIFGTPTGLTYQMTSQVGEDDGSGVEAYVDTKDYYFVDEKANRVVGKINGFRFKATGTKTYLYYSVDEGVTYTNVKAAGFTLNPSHKIHEVTFRKQANQIRFRFYKSAVGESFNLRSMSFNVQLGGRIFVSS